MKLLIIVTSNGKMYTSKYYQRRRSNILKYGRPPAPPNFNAPVPYPTPNKEYIKPYQDQETLYFLSTTRICIVNSGYSLPRNRLTCAKLSEEIISGIDVLW